MDQVKRGRKPGGLARFKCCHCGELELTRGGDNKFVCSACRDSGLKRPNDRIGDGASYAIGLVNRAVSDGRLASIHTHECVDCGARAKHYDHRDYNKPLDVQPVCHSCNLKRGPAIPRFGYFANAYRRADCCPYRRREDTRRLFLTMGIDIDLSSLPRTLTAEHWLPFKAQLLEWESKR